MLSNNKSSLILLLVVQLTVNFRSGIISPILALFIRGHGLSVSQIGVLGIAGMLGWFLFEPLFGVVADRVKKKYMIIFAIFTSTTLYAFYPYAQSIWQFAILSFSMASVMSAYAVSVKAMAAELIPSSERGKTYGRYLSVISWGGIIAPFIGGYISDVFSYSIPFFLSAGVGIVALIAAFLLKHDEDRSNEEVSWNFRSTTKGLFTPPFLGILTMRMVTMVSMVFRQNFLPIYLHENPQIDASETQIGTYLTLFRITSAISQPYIGQLNDRIGSKKVIMSSVALLGLTYAGLTVINGIIPLFILGAFQGIVLAAADMSMMIHLMTIMPEGRTGIVMGLYSESENVGGLIVSPSLGYIYEGFSANSSVLTVAAVLFATAIASVFLVKNESLKSGDLIETNVSEKEDG
jgi:MFS family permease